MGKSALLGDTAMRASGFRVLRTAGLESESALAFAALHRLLRPAWDGLAVLPAPQRRALRVRSARRRATGSTRVWWRWGRCRC